MSGLIRSDKPESKVVSSDPLQVDNVDSVAPKQVEPAITRNNNQFPIGSIVGMDQHFKRAAMDAAMRQEYKKIEDRLMRETLSGSGYRRPARKIEVRFVGGSLHGKVWEIDDTVRQFRGEFGERYDLWEVAGLYLFVDEKTGKAKLIEMLEGSSRPSRNVSVRWPERYEGG